MHADMSRDELQRRVRHFEELAAVCSYGPDKKRFQAQAEAFRRQLATPEPEARSFRPR